ncbi:MAG: DUF2723 domain-containing protein [Planctomycetota bacterium]|nr:MAG: DUF2723 domain-containing protein [Planctomycetota bacterium]
MSETANSGPGTDSHTPRIRFNGWLVVFLMSFILYAATANRGPQWQDSGSHIIRIFTGDISNPRGLALFHPLHYWLGRLAIAPGVLEPCFAITLVSSLAGALAVANVFGCVLSLTRKYRAALFAAVSLALACTFWQLATLTETYTLCAALLAGECWCLVEFARQRRRWFMYGMLLLNGLGIANHMLASLTTPVLAVVVFCAIWRKHINLKDVIIAAVLWLVGTLPYSSLVVAEMMGSADITGTIRSALFGRSYAENVLNTTLSLRVLTVSLGYMIYNFPNLLLPSAFYGMASARQFDTLVVARRALLAGLIIHVCFVLRYNIVDQHTFFLPLYVLLAIFGGVGAAGVLQWGRLKARRVVCALGVLLLLTTPVVYGVVPAVARHYDLLEKYARNKPYRDDYNYLLAPWSIAERSAEIMSTEAVRLAGPRGLIVVEDAMARFAIQYRMLRTSQHRIEMCSGDCAASIQKAVGEERPVVLVPQNVAQPNTVPPMGCWLRSGDLYVVKVTATQSSQAE